MFKTASDVAMILVALLDAPTINARAIDLDSPATPADGGNGDLSTSIKNLLSSDGIDWNTFLAIQVAAAEASRRGVKLKNCRITAAEWGERLLVSFGNPDPSHRWRGCPPGPCTCFDVELSIDGLRLLAAHFSKQDLLPGSVVSRFQDPVHSAAREGFKESALVGLLPTNRYVWTEGTPSGGLLSQKFIMKQQLPELSRSGEPPSSPLVAYRSSWNERTDDLRLARFIEEKGPDPSKCLRSGPYWSGTPGSNRRPSPWQ